MRTLRSSRGEYYLSDNCFITNPSTLQVRRAPIGPGLRPGPRRQARWAGRGLRRSRVGPEDRFCGAVRNDLRVPLTLEGPARTMRGVPAPALWSFIRRLTYPACSDRLRQLAERTIPRCVTARCLLRPGAGHRRGGQRPATVRYRARGSGPGCPPPAARVPTTPGRHGTAPRLVHALRARPAHPRESRPAPVGLARRRCALEAV
jgi:hypothetical protein